MKAIVISGSMGSGKTSVVGEASDILRAHDISHAAIDLDWLGSFHVRSGVRDDVVYRNLAVVWANYVALGISNLLLAGALETKADLEACRAALPDPEIIVCRLIADIRTMKQRLVVRETGVMKERYIERISTLNEILNRSPIEDFSVTNQGRSITQVAEEILIRAGWLSAMR